MKIQSLLNAPLSPDILPPCSSLSVNNSPPTPEYTSQVSSIASTPAPRTPVAAPLVNFRQKMAKDAAIFQRGPVKQPVNYAPYECNENNGILSKAERKELMEQHKRFKIFPSGGDEGQIYDYVRHIPYNSEKKTFFGKTGREGFERKSYPVLLSEKALLTMTKSSNMSFTCPMIQTGSMWSCGTTKTDLSASRLSSNRSTIPRCVSVPRYVFNPTDT